MYKPLNRRDLIKLAASIPLFGAARRLVPAATSYVPQPDRPNFLIIVLDALSTTHMSLHGYPRETTPNLKRMARRATVFNRHYAGGNFTSPGTASLLTGSYPWSQRAFNFQGTVTKEYERRNLFRLFGQAGYHRVAYTHNWLVTPLLDQFRADIDYCKPVRELCLTDTELSDRMAAKDHDVALSVERVLNFRSGFGTGSLFLSLLKQAQESHDENALLAQYKPLFPRGLPTNAETTYFTLENAVDWIQKELRQAPRPFLGYFHLLPPHDPYNSRKEFIGRFTGDGYVETPKPLHPLGVLFDEAGDTRLRSQYDEMIAYTDAEIGRLYDSLRQAGILDNTFLIVTSDHGEILARGRRGHLNPFLYEPLTHIPLIISGPGQNKRVNVSTPTSCLDLLPTLAHLIGQPIPNWCEGELLPTFGGEARTGRSIFTLEAKSSPKHAPLAQATVAMVKDEYKLIYYRGYEKGFDNLFEMYDLGKDPEELTDLSASAPGLVAPLKAELLTKLEEANHPYQHI